MTDEELKPGSRWSSAVYDTQVIVVGRRRPPSCCSAAATRWCPPAATSRRASRSTRRSPRRTPIGKRFADEETGLELLATKGGAGTLARDGIKIPLKDAKPLPASD